MYRGWRRQILLVGASVLIVTVIALSQRIEKIQPSIFLPTRKASHALPISLATPVTGSTVSRPVTSKTPTCPTIPPKPAITPDTRGRFNWRAIPVQNPVDSYIELPTGTPSPLPRVQHAFAKPSAEAIEKNISRRKAVRQVFERCWNGYRNQAWMEDELAPVSGSSKKTFGGYGATLVDSLDTLWIMDMRQEFVEAVDSALYIDFGPNNPGEIDMFQMIVRYLGGFIAAYDISDCHDSRLLQKAIEVGDMAYASFDTPNRMPVTRWNPNRAVDGQKQYPGGSGSLAELASASVEFTRLSQLTGDMRYFDAISRITNVLDDQQNRTKLPGMWPVGVNAVGPPLPGLKVHAPDLTSGSLFSLGAMSDSAYEYLPKMYQLLAGVGEAAAQYRRMYEYAMRTVIGHTLFRPMVKDEADILVTSSVWDGGRRDSSGHVVCFTGGMLGLGGRLTENKTHVDVGRKLTDGCVWMYEHSPMGIMPEAFSMPTCPGLSECAYTRERGSSPFSKIDDARYLLRPEAIESIFYMYRITGNPAYQDQAWDMFEAIESMTATQHGNAALQDVTRTFPQLDDSMESFWMAETLKYFYLIFSEPDTISLDDWVFNTQAHPFRIPRP